MILIRSTPQFSFVNHPNAYFLVSNAKSNSQHDHPPKEGGDLVETHRIPVYEIRDVHVTEETNSFVLSMDLPGVKEKDVKVIEENFCLTVEGVRKNGGDKAICSYQRTFALDQKSITPDDITATLCEGVLTITIPKKPAPETVHITPRACDPPAEVEEHIFFRMDMPGVKLPDLQVSVTGDEILVTADRKKGSTTTSSIKRMFTVDENKMDTNGVGAYLCNGIFTLTAPPRSVSSATTKGKEESHENPDKQDGNNTNSQATDHHVILVNRGEKEE